MTAPLPLDRVYLAHTLAEPAFGDSPDDLFYVKTADGRRSIVRQSAATGLASVITTEPMPKGGIGYGGGIFHVRGSCLVYAAADGRLHQVDLLTGRQQAITPAAEGVAAPVISPCGKFVAYLCEQEAKCNVLLTELGGKALPVKLSDDPWFAFNPAFSIDGRRIAWQEWNEMDMPWDESRLQIARLARPMHDCSAAHQVFPQNVTTISKPGVSFSSPQFSPDGKSLAFTSDETGWRSLWVAGADGSNAVRLQTGEGEIGRPDWIPGLISMRWSGDSRSIYTVRRHESQDAILRVAWSEREVTALDAQWTEVSGLNILQDSLVFMGASGTAPPALVTFDGKGRNECVRATSAVGVIDVSSLSKPEVVSWKTVGGTTTWGILYPARISGPAAEPRPLIVFVHGGPTADKALTWDPQAQYFATRGWHYLALNYRGSTGFGRKYQDSLNGEWGVLDVQDARSGAINLIDSGRVDPKRAVIMGGSAGGYTTLMALALDPDFWAAGVSLYGIGNMYEVKQGSHRFEVNYEERLIGRLPEAGALWKERSALTHVKNVRAPVLLFHGTEDKAVPYQQSVEFAEAVRRNGGIADLVSYQGEGHGFLKEANRRDLIERIERFLTKYVLCQQRP
jgi:dipeptidyl aminopeptidase/acylaminoacyl peptidase